MKSAVLLLIIIATFIGTTHEKVPVQTRTSTARRSFDYSLYYEPVYPPKPSKTLSAYGPALRENNFIPSVADQVQMTRFTDIDCDMQSRTWYVTYTDALEDDVWGPTELFAIGDCGSASSSDTYNLVQVNGSETGYYDKETGILTTDVTFVLDDPSVNQNILDCTFKLFVTSDNPEYVFTVPRGIDKQDHQCDENDGKYCGFWELFCMFDADTYKGAAAFWEFIYFWEIVVIGGIGLWIRWKSLSKDIRIHEDRLGDMNAQNFKKNEKTDETMEVLDSMTIPELEAEYHELTEEEVRIRSNNSDEYWRDVHAKETSSSSSQYHVNESKDRFAYDDGGGTQQRDGGRTHNRGQRDSKRQRNVNSQGRAHIEFNMDGRV